MQDIIWTKNLQWTHSIPRPHGWAIVPFVIILEKNGRDIVQVQFIDVSHQNLKSRFFSGMNKTFLWVDLSFFNQSYSGGVTTTRKPTGYWRYYHSRCHLAVMRAAMMESDVHIMSDELILQISCNIFMAFKWILMMTSGQNISHYTTAKLSVYVWNHDLIWWQNKIDT